MEVDNGIELGIVSNLVEVISKVCSYPEGIILDEENTVIYVVYPDHYIITLDNVYVDVLEEVV